ncbi:GntR family transcriptional regulator [Paracoccus sp. T5]|uniref:GntR family transcriptional regulator n=1 Tax=Paracoccus sp. T5 TaxID=3402161 RepID=UPI003AE991E0
MTVARSADQIHAALSRQIVAGQLRPGDPLAETALAARFGVSRTPTREALHRLATEGLVERGPRRAFLVRRMSPEVLRDLFEALGELEALCASLAAHRMTPIERAALEAILAEGEDPEADYAAVNRRFHDALRSGGQNVVLSGMLDDLNRRSMPWRSAQFEAQPDRMDSSRAEHRAIVQAVLAQDGTQAAALMRAHMAASLGVVLEMLTRHAEQEPTHAR